MITAHMDIQIIQDENVTAAELMVPEGYEGAVGSARRHPTDQWDQGIGMKIALGRLFEKLAESYLAEAQAMQDARSEPEPTIIHLDAEFLKSLGIPDAEMM